MPTMSLYVAAPLLICLLVLLVVRSRRAGREIDAQSSASFESMVAPYGASQAPAATPAPPAAPPVAPAPVYGEVADQPPMSMPAMPFPAMPADPYAPAVSEPMGYAPQATVMAEPPIPPAAPVIPQQSLPQPGELLSFGEPAAAAAYQQPPVAQPPAFPESFATPQMPAFEAVATPQLPAFPEPAPAPVERPFPDPDFVLPPVTILPGK